jgi:hypothetical protein
VEESRVDEGILIMQRWHVGLVVGDIDTAFADYRRLGSCMMSSVARLVTSTFDVEEHTVINEPLDVAWVRDGYGETFELIAPVGSAGPQARFLSERAGPSHLAYWCVDPASTAESLLRDGARLVLLVLSDPEGWEARVAEGGPSALLQVAAATYLRLAGGLMIELNSWQNRSSMVNLWGDTVLRAIPALDEQAFGGARRGSG